MTILAFEFSSPQRSAAVLRAGGAATAAEAIASGESATNPLGLIEQALAEAKVEREQIEVIAVGLGPGSYTGIRTALAIAQGWQVASTPRSSTATKDGRGMKLLGVSSADCLAAQAQAEGIRGRVTVVLDAQRNEFYLATYETTAAGWNRIEPLRILTAAEVQSRAGAREILIGPEATRWFPGGRTVFPRAATLARIAVGRKDFVAGEKLEPIYLREAKFTKAPRRASAAL
jgi:tRNA threonylcarbamoyladenosine biosynthesis protein TsaB